MLADHYRSIAASLAAKGVAPSSLLKISEQCSCQPFLQACRRSVSPSALPLPLPLLRSQSIPVATKRQFVGIANNRTNRRPKFATSPTTASATRWLSGDTYYDSQSGRHVPIHDENRCTAYLSGKNHPGHATDDARALGMAGSVMWMPLQQQKSQDHDGLAKLFKSWSLLDGNGGCSGNRDRRASRKKEGIRSGEDDPFTVFLRVPPKHQLLTTRQDNSKLVIPNNVNLCFEYTGETETIASEIHSAVSNHASNRASSPAGTTPLQMSIGIFHPSHYDDPISVASDVATLIDNTMEHDVDISRILLLPGGGTRVVVADHKVIVVDEDGHDRPNDGSVPVVEDDDLIRMCEELSYLDVPGPTIKSRLVVQALGEDVLMEILTMGITKYVVDDDEGASLHMLIDATREAGRDLYLGGEAVRSEIMYEPRGMEVHESVADVGRPASNPVEDWDGGYGRRWRGGGGSKNQKKNKKKKR